MEHYGIWYIGNKRLCESSVKKNFQYQIAVLCYHDKFLVEAWHEGKMDVTSWLRQTVNWDFIIYWLYVGYMLVICWLYIGYILVICWLYVGYKDLLEKVILLWDVLFNWVVSITVNTRSTSWNYLSVINGRSCLFRRACSFFNLLTKMFQLIYSFLWFCYQFSIRGRK